MVIKSFEKNTPVTNGKVNRLVAKGAFVASDGSLNSTLVPGSVNAKLQTNFIVEGFGVLSA